ncbi:MAG TPA: SpoIID/LytB domain-containing protein [Solirubrobacterales bacterium]|nr:SpoIID/LytB domain-containing protein [Solirubrobacterales bacterium]
MTIRPTRTRRATVRPGMVGVPVAVLLALLALAPAARASVNWVVRGHGFGHGVGVSQYGAYGYALHGKDYEFILGHYYRGSTIGQTSGPRVVRVLLDISPGDVSFSGATSACGVALDPGREYEAHRAGNRVKLRSAAGKPLADCGGRLRAAGRGKVRIGGVGTYRGALESVPTESQAGSLNVINALAVEQYVKGVIANESPPSWPAAELRTQAIESRSFALSVDVEGNGFDLYDDTRSQVYDGYSSETAATNAAVEATKGEVVMYGGRVAETYFSACSGGYTESVQNVFFGPVVPYLTGVPDPYDYYCPLHDWTLRFSGPEISAKLGAHLDGRLEQVVVTKRGVSPRIVAAKLVGSGGVTKVTGEQLQVALGAYSTWMSFQKIAG